MSSPLPRLQEAPEPLHVCVERALDDYFRHLGGNPPSDLYALVLSQVEAPLFRTVMAYTRGNQSKAARILGINRATLRKKLLHYGLSP